MFTSAAHAQTGDWARLQSQRHGATLIVETNVNPYGPATFDRCRLKAVDATTLTCTTLGWAGKRIVFPAKSIDAVYKVKQPWVEGAIGVGLVGLFVGGALSGNPPAIAISLLGGLVMLFVSSAQQTSRAWHEWWYGPDPMPRDEHRELLYLRPVAPPPTN
jgi:hypothetical protein